MQPFVDAIYDTALENKGPELLKLSRGSQIRTPQENYAGVKKAQKDELDQLRAQEWRKICSEFRAKKALMEHDLEELRAKTAEAKSQFADARNRYLTAKTMVDLGLAVVKLISGKIVMNDDELASLIQRLKNCCGRKTARWWQSTNERCGPPSSKERTHGSTSF